MQPLQFSRTPLSPSPSRSARPIPLNALVLPSLPQSQFQLTSSLHNLSWGEFDKTKLREPKEPDAAREKRAKERGKNSVIYLTLFINFPFLALVTRLQRSLPPSLARGTHHDIIQGEERDFGTRSPILMMPLRETLSLLRIPTRIARSSYLPTNRPTCPPP